MADFSVRSCLAARLSRRVGGVPRARGCPSWSSGRFRLVSRVRQGLQPGDGGGDLAGPGPAWRRGGAAGGGRCGRGGRRRRTAAAAAVWVPSGGRGRCRASICIQAVQFAGQRDDLAPDLVLGEVVQRQVAQAGVLGAADPVLAAGPAAVPQFQVGELAAAWCWWRSGEPVPVDVGEPQLRAGVRAFLADDHPHPGRPAGQVEQAGELGDPGAVADLAVGVVGRCPRLGRGPAGSRPAMSSVRVNPTE